jgi:hypothetical protein
LRASEKVTSDNAATGDTRPLEVKMYDNPSLKLAIS